MNLPTPKEIENTKKLRKLWANIQYVFLSLIQPEFTAPLGKPRLRSVVYQFGNCLTLSSQDTGRLPYWTGTDRAVTPRKTDCVLAIVSCVVVGYWLVRHTKGTLDTRVIECRLNQLRYIVEHWDELKVVGSIRERYYLSGIPEFKGIEDEQEERDEIREKETETETD